jgi:O-antigen ligase
VDYAFRFDVRPVVLVGGLAFLAGGTELGGHWQPARLILALGAIVGVFMAQKIPNSDTRVVRHFLLLIGIWFAWGVASIVWTPEQMLGISEMSALGLAMATALGVVVMVGETQQLKFIFRGWLAAVWITLPIAIWELTTFQHLPGALITNREDAADRVNGANVFACASFSNRNTYIVFLLLACPAMLWGVGRARGFVKFVGMLAIAIAMGIIFVDASRLGTLLVLLEVLAWLPLVGPGRKPRPRTVLATVLILGASFYSISNMPHATERLLSLAQGRDLSSFIRGSLYANGMKVLASAYGFGVGAGGFGATMFSDRDMAPTLGIGAPHNLWIEIASQYGIPVLLILLMWFARCWLLLWRGMRLAHEKSDKERESAFLAGLIWLLILPLTGLINSGLMTYPMLWAVFGCICVLSHFAKKFLDEVGSRREIAMGRAA